MSNEHLDYFYQTFLGLQAEPYWWSKRSKIPAAISALWNTRQKLYFQGGDQSEFNDQLLMITRSYGIKKDMVYFLLGIASTNPHDPYNSVRTYLNKHDPKLIIK